MADFFRMQMYERLGRGPAPAARLGQEPLEEVWNGDQNPDPDDLHHGTEDADTLNGLGGNDTLFGHGGNDSISGQVNNDFLAGGAGDDILYDTDGRDYADGGDGADNITLGNINGSDKVTAYGRDGNDVMTLHGLTKAFGGAGDDYISLSGARVVAGQLQGDGGKDILFIGQNVVFQGNFTPGLAGFEFVSASHAFSGDNGPNLLNFSGVGQLLAYPNGFTIFAEQGDDTIIGSIAGDFLHGGAGKDRLFGWLGNDTLNGEDGEDEINGQDGNDTLHAQGIDVALGEAGDDLIFLTNLTTGDGGAGRDTIDLQGCGVLSSGQVQGGAGQDTLVVEESTTFHANRFDLTDASFEVLAPEAPIRGDFDDNKLLFGHARLADGYTGAIFFGDDGDDLLQGLHDSNDQIHGDDGTDTLNGLTGDDTLWSGLGGLDELIGGGGNDVLHREAGNVDLDGGDGADVLEVSGLDAPELPAGEVFGGAGDDRIRLESAQVMSPPAGLSGSLAAGATGGLDAGAGQDTLELGGGVFFEGAKFIAKKADFEVLTATTQVEGGGGANLISFAGLAVVGGLGGAWINGQGGNDTLVGTGAQDRLIGGGAQDRLRGGGGQDSLFGGDGDDTVEGGDGNDSLSGEANTDTVTYENAAAAVTVSLAISGVQDTYGAGMDTLATFENLTGSRYADTLFGNAGDNRIRGGLGADTMAGGGGADVFVIGPGHSARRKADLITDLSANDVVDLSGIDADQTQAGNQAFILGTTFTGNAGEAILVYVAGLDRTFLSMDTDGDAKADDVVAMAGDHTGHAGFVL